MRLLLTSVLLVWSGIVVSAQLAVTVAPAKVTGQKAVIRIGMKNTFPETIESARAAVFLADPQGKMAGKTVQWVIGGTKDKPALAPDKESTFNFVVTVGQCAGTNLVPTVVFNRLVLKGGKEANPVKDVRIQKVEK